MPDTGPREFTAIETPRLGLIPATVELIDAVLAGAAAGVGLTVPPGWPDEHDAAFLARKRDEIAADAALAQWVRLLLLHDGPAGASPVAAGPALVVGHAGFHGPPGVNGSGAPDALELGYTVFEPWRGQGLAREAAAALIGWAAALHGIHRYFGSVSPGNAPSIAVLERLGFEHVGDQLDDVDGLELVYELRYLPAAADT